MSDLTPDVAPPSRRGAGTDHPVVDGDLPRDATALRDELVKWRDRVPKLAQALRQRSEETQSLRAELARGRAELERLRAGQDAAGGESVAAGIRAREELIAELEAKLTALTQQHNEAQGDLHQRQLVIDGLRADVDAWKVKWQSVTRALDEQANIKADQAADQEALRQALAERDAAWQRNEQLLESTDLASRQVAALTSDVTALRAALQQQREDAAKAVRAAEQAGEQAAERARANAVQAAEQASADNLQAAERTAAQALEQVSTLEARVRHLAAQLDERSRLVVSLEQDQRKHDEHLQRLERERDELQESLRRAERHVRENSEHVTKLDDKLERQKTLMDELEQELAEAHEAAQSRRSDDAQQVETLRGQVRKLEALLRERTEAFNQLQWQRDMAAAPAATAAAPEPVADARMLLVLNQQLEDARQQNAVLLARVRELEPAPVPPGSAPQTDDLTQIRGIGPKLAQQLNALGIRHYRQIGEVRLADLENPNHQLHLYRSRIGRDRWVEQANRLAGAEEPAGRLDASAAQRRFGG